MGTCMARRGFLTLSDCGNPAANMCSTCARPMCAAHLSPQSGFTQCYDCAATQPKQEEGEGEESTEYDDTWAHNYRDDYYRTSSYAPIYTGSSHDSYYDSQDVRSFEGEQGEQFDEEDVAGADFGES